MFHQHHAKLLMFPQCWKRSPMCLQWGAMLCKIADVLAMLAMLTMLAMSQRYWPSLKDIEEHFFWESVRGWNMHIGQKDWICHKWKVCLHCHSPPPSDVNNSIPDCLSKAMFLNILKEVLCPQDIADSGNLSRHHATLPMCPQRRMRLPMSRLHRTRLPISLQHHQSKP